MNPTGNVGSVGYLASCKRVAGLWTFGKDKRNTSAEASHEAMSVVDPDFFEIDEILAASSGIAWVLV